MFLATIGNDETRKSICNNLVAFMAVDGKIDTHEKEQIKAVFSEAGLSINALGLDLLSSINKEELKENLKEILEELETNKQRQFLFEIISCAVCNEDYHTTQSEIIDFVAEEINMGESEKLELKDIATTLLVVQKRTENVLFGKRI